MSARGPLSPHAARLAQPAVANKILAAIRGRVPDGEVDDLVQGTYLRALLVPKPPNDTKQLVWQVAAIARGVVVDFYRQRGRVARRLADGHDPDEVPIEDAPSSLRDPLEVREMLSWIEREVQGGRLAEEILRWSRRLASRRWPRLAQSAVAIAVASTWGCGEPLPLERNESIQEALQQCAGSTVEGIDIFDGTGSVTWSAVKAAGVDFAIIKAAQGTYNSQSTFAADWSGAKAAGLFRSAYHFFDPTEDGIAQAQHFLTVVGTLAADDLPAMLDIECPDGSSNCLGTGASGATPATTIHQRMWDWIHTVEMATGKAPLIYSYGSYFSSNGIDTTGLGAYPLNIADVTTASCFNVPSPWQKAAIWQYSWTGTVNGISGQVDRDRFLGSLSDLQAFALGGASAAQNGRQDAMAETAATPADARAAPDDAESGANRATDASVGPDGGGAGGATDAQAGGEAVAESSDSGAGAMGSAGAGHGSSSGCGCHFEKGGDGSWGEALAFAAVVTGIARRRRTACGRSARGC